MSTANTLDRTSSAIESERCKHALDTYTCTFCVWPSLAIESEQAGSQTARASRSLARSLARALRKHERERDTLRGYSMLSARMLDAIESTARKQAREHGIDPADIGARTLDAFALWIARQDREHIESVRDSMRHTGSIARRIARRIARKSGTGRGSMPRLDVSKHAQECTASECVPYCGMRMLNAALDGVIVRSTLASVARIDADTWQEHYACEHIDSQECEKQECNNYARRIARTLEIERANKSAPHDRSPNESERESIAETLDYERTQGAPDYPRWLDAFGHTAPSTGSAHPVGHRAPGVPERDAPSMRRASVLDVAHMLALDVRTLAAALDETRLTRRGTIALDVKRVQARTHDTRHTANTRKHIERMLDAIIEHDRTQDRDSYALDAPGVRLPMWSIVHRHACDERCVIEREHDRSIIESTYRGGVQLRAPHALIFPGEHSHERVSLWRDPVLDRIIESTHMSDASECAYCREWQERTSSTAHAYSMWHTLSVLDESERKYMREQARLRVSMYWHRKSDRAIALRNHRASNRRLVAIYREQEQERARILDTIEHTA